MARHIIPVLLFLLSYTDMAYIVKVYNYGLAAYCIVVWQTEALSIYALSSNCVSRDSKTVASSFNKKGKIQDLRGADGKTKF